MFDFFKKLIGRKKTKNTIRFNYVIADIGYIPKMRDKNGRFVKGHSSYYDGSQKRNKKGQFMKGKTK